MQRKIEHNKKWRNELKQVLDQPNTYAYRRVIARELSCSQSNLMVDKIALR